MTATQFLFWFLSILALFGAIMVVVSKKPHTQCIVADCSFLFNIRPLYFTQRTISGNRKSDRVCWCNHGFISFCDHVDEFECGNGTSKNKWLKIAGVIGGGALLLVLVAALKSADMHNRIAETGGGVLD